MRTVTARPLCALLFLFLECLSDTASISVLYLHGASFADDLTSCFALRLLVFLVLLDCTSSLDCKRCPLLWSPRSAILGIVVVWHELLSVLCNFFDFSELNKAGVLEVSIHGMQRSSNRIFAGAGIGINALLLVASRRVNALDLPFRLLALLALPGFVRLRHLTARGLALSQLAIDVPIHSAFVVT